MRARTMGLGVAGGLLVLGMALALSQGALAIQYIDGDWTISGVETYANDTIQVNSTGGTGNIYILAGGELHLDNILLLFPSSRTFDNQGYLEVRNSTIRSGSWFFYLRSAADLSDVTLQNVSRSLGGSLSGTVVTSPNVTLTRVRWEYGIFGMAATDWTIHIRAIMDFTTNYVGRRGQIAYELPTITADATIQIAYNRFQMAAGFGNYTDAVVIDNALHSGNVVYDIHDNNFTDGRDNIVFGSSTAWTTYLIHDNTFVGCGSTCIEVGDGAAADRFGGTLRVWNLSILQSNRALRVFGVIGGGGTGTADNVSIRYVGGNPFFPPSGIHANEFTWIITNSTVAMRTGDTQYRSEQNAHIKIYTTADSALRDIEAQGAGASVEHFAFLNVLGATWQNSVPILASFVNLREAAGNLSLTIDPQNWSPREIVWWGVYNQNPQVDNRDLRPEIEDRGRNFACAPTPIIVAEPMSPVSITCTDNLAPAITVVKPSQNSLQNSSSIAANGTVAEFGSGLNTLEWSLDNASWGPVTLGPGPSDWRVTAPGLTDGVYTLYLRAVDRTGLMTIRSVANIRVDLTPPALAIPQLANYTSDFVLDLSGSTEAGATVTYLLGAFDTNTTLANGSGNFTFLPIFLSEGFNTLYITATDAAGNQFTLRQFITLDTTAPSLVVDQAQYILTPEDTIVVSGRTEATATVTVNGISAPRAGEPFTLQLSLTPGATDIRVVATDPAGNAAFWFGRAVSDSDKPTLIASIITGNVSGGIPVTRVGSVPITGTVTDATSSIVLLTINGTAYQPDGAGAFLVSLPVGEGDTEVRISATDAAGNVATVTLHVIRDSTPPSAVSTLEAADSPFVAVGDSLYTRGNFVLVSLVVNEDGEATVSGETLPVTVGANLFNVTLHEGLNTISISFQDRAGNSGAPRSLGIYRDTTAPLVQISTPVDGAALDGDTAQVQGVSEAGATVTVNGARVSLTGTGFATGVALKQGEATTITVVATDLVGNTASATLSVTRKAATDSAVTPADGGSGMLLLVLGLAGGVAVGFIVRGKSKGRQEVDRAERSTQPGPVTDAEPRGQAPLERGPKGPRGPSPP